MCRISGLGLPCPCNGCNFGPGWPHGTCHHFMHSLGAPVAARPKPSCQLLAFHKIESKFNAWFGFGLQQTHGLWGMHVCLISQDWNRAWCKKAFLERRSVAEGDFFVGEMLRGPHVATTFGLMAIHKFSQPAGNGCWWCVSPGGERGGTEPSDQAMELNGSQV